MKYVVTALLGAVVTALLAHLGVVFWQPQLIQAHYPEFIARHYLAKSGVGKRDETVRLEPVDGRPGISRVVLTEAAVERLGIETVEITVRPIERVRNIGSVVLSASSLPPTAPSAAQGSGLVLVVELSSGIDTPAADERAVISPLHVHTSAGTGQLPTLVARPVGIVAATADKGARRTAYYVLDGSASGLEPGDFVLARLPLVRNGAPSSVLPESAVLYEPNGTAWAYANPAPRVFVREPLDIELTHDGTAVLRRGPPPGTRVVTVGAFELYGAESAIGIEKVGH